jgi:uncharacterized protein GlcG (DUF336 family)
MIDRRPAMLRKLRNSKSGHALRRSVERLERRWFTGSVAALVEQAVESADESTPKSPPSATPRRNEARSEREPSRDSKPSHKPDNSPRATDPPGESPPRDESTQPAKSQSAPGSTPASQPSDEPGADKSLPSTRKSPASTLPTLPTTKKRRPGVVGEDDLDSAGDSGGSASLDENDSAQTRRVRAVDEPADATSERFARDVTNLSSQAAGQTAGSITTPTPLATPPSGIVQYPEMIPIPAPVPGPVFSLAPAGANITAAEAADLLDKASAATSSTDAIIAIVDRGGRILGVRIESGVALPDLATTVFAIDGAVSKARTAAFFASNEAPLTSRTIRILSQSTITQREVESNPNDPSLASTTRGPGFVAPIGLGGHFPPGVMHTPPVDLFDIEHTNRDSSVHPGADHVKGTADDLPLAARFNIDPAFVPAGQSIEAPESYGFTSGLMPSAQSRGIATLPGGVPLYRNGLLVGGIGVFFPGPDGYATHEQGFIAGIGQSSLDRTNAAKVLEAEFIAFAAAGGSSEAGLYIPTTPGYTLPDLNDGRIDLVGITLEVIGPLNLKLGVPALLDVGRRVGPGVVNGTNQPLGGVFTRDGVTVPDGWLVTPHDSPIGDLTAADVERIITQGITEADLVRAAIRLREPDGNKRTKMVFSVTDTAGNVLGLYRMPDATVFSIDVAVSKARNVAYYADPAALVAADRIDIDGDGTFDSPTGVAFSNRTFRFLAEPRYPSGVDGTVPPPFSVLLTPGINPATGENIGAPLPATAFTTVAAFDAFNPGTNFRDPADIANQSGIVFFPGSTPVYRDGVLRGGFGVSGDGVDQDDVVTFSGAQGFLPPPGVLQADDIIAARVRLPFIKFLRNPRG